MAHDQVADEHADGDPDQDERAELERRELLAKEDDRQNELPGRRAELEQPDGGEGQEADGVGEADERDDGDDPAEEHDPGDPLGGGRCEEDSLIGLHEPDHEGDAEGEENDHLEGDADGAGDIDFFAEQAVEPEAGGEQERDPGPAAAGLEFGDGHEDHGASCDRDRGFLQSGRLFAEEEEAEEDREERVDVVAQRGVVEAVGADGVDKEIPVDRDEPGRGDEDFECGPPGCGADEVGEFFAQHEDENEEGEAEHDALGEDLQRHRVVLGEEAEVGRHDDSPPPERAGGVHISLSAVEVFGAHGGMVGGRCSMVWKTCFSWR